MLPGGGCLARLPGDTWAALALPEGPRAGPRARTLLEELVPHRAWREALLRSRGFAAGRTSRGPAAVFRGGPSPAGAKRVPSSGGDFFFLGPPGGSSAEGRGLGEGRAWKVLSRAASAWEGDLLLWLSPARAAEGLSSLSSLQGRGGRTGTRPAGNLLSSSLSEILNLEAFEALLARVREERRGRAGLFLWPDRVGLPGALLPARGGLRGEIPREGEFFLAWRIDPEGVRSLLAGLKSLPGPAGGISAAVFSALESRAGLDLERTLPSALAGPVVLRGGRAGGVLAAALRPGKAAEALTRAFREKGGALALSFLSGGRVKLTLGEDRLLLAWGKGRPSPEPEVSADPESEVIGLFRLPLVLGGRSLVLQGRVRRASFGMEARFEIRD